MIESLARQTRAATPQCQMKERRKNSAVAGVDDDKGQRAEDVDVEGNSVDGAAGDSHTGEERDKDGLLGDEVVEHRNYNMEHADPDDADNNELQEGLEHATKC